MSVYVLIPAFAAVVLGMVTGEAVDSLARRPTWGLAVVVTVVTAGVVAGLVWAAMQAVGA